MSVIQHRYDFVYYFDCQDGNPNGDPDADNQPRVDPETSQGLVSDVCIKRKIRDYIFQSQQKDGQQIHGYDIFVQSGHTLESRQCLPYEHLHLSDFPNGFKGEQSIEQQEAREKAITKKGDKKIKLTRNESRESNIAQARAWMCENFFDVRAFGAVMSTTDFNCGQVRGPVQLTFSRSVDPVLSTEHTISRQAFTGGKDIKNSSGTFGRKYTIAYGLYRMHGFISPIFAEIGKNPENAKGTGFTEDDLSLFWKALGGMFDLDHSAARGLMTPRKLVVFKHNSRLGHAPANILFETVKAEKSPNVEMPRSFQDYLWKIPTATDLPAGVKLLFPLEPVIDL
jgi:CRISPR-associated protein Csd2